MSKSDFVFEVLGTIDELNCTLGYAKALAHKFKLSLFVKNKRTSYGEILENFQQNLFCIQAELAGSSISGKEEKVTYLEDIIYEVETLLPPIKSFIVPGGGEAGAYLDLARTVARKTERMAVSLKDKSDRELSGPSLVFLNRLSSALYALARFANYQEGRSEGKPSYS